MWRVKTKLRDKDRVTHANKINNANTINHANKKKLIKINELKETR